MEGQAKLTRTNSSLLRSSPTIRSSIHSLSSVNKEDVIITPLDEDENKVKKPHKSEVPTSENLLLALIFIVVALYFVSKNKGLINQSLSVPKHAWDENVRRLGFSKPNSKHVHWFIGDSLPPKREKRRKL
ncbi:MORN repeat-containing protein 1-like [Senna tora]|uniref:MORN repeat-containing protein 1-like n=1 Tax=Senna tora TaxID=362788 RepID=A0A834XFH9_9FABA|nr:MORN repeat-containing protein 1-like [Senna tora]